MTFNQTSFLKSKEKFINDSRFTYGGLGDDWFRLNFENYAFHAELKDDSVVVFHVVNSDLGEPTVIAVGDLDKEIESWFRGDKKRRP